MKQTYYGEKEGPKMIARVFLYSWKHREWNLISEDDFEEFSFLLKREAEKTESSIPLGLTYIIMFVLIMKDHYNALQLMV